jgi:hypothetical protein
MTRGANLGTRDIYFFVAAQSCLFKSDRYGITKVITTSGRLASSPAGPAEEGFKDVSEAAYIKAFEAPAEEAFGAIMAEPVITGALIGVREDFISLVDFLELLLGAIIVITVGMILERQLTKSLLNILRGGITG